VLPPSQHTILVGICASDRLPFRFFSLVTVHPPHYSRQVPNTSSGLRRLSLLLLIAWALVPTTIAAHEIPNDVTVQVWLRPAGQTLQMAVRVPLEAMRDINWPTHGPGYIDIEAAGLLLGDAATVWLANDVEVYEDGQRLAIPRIVTTRLSLPSDPSFRAYDNAIDHIAGPGLDASVDIVWQQTMLDVLFEYSIRSELSDFSVRPGTERLGLRVLTVLRFVRPDGVIRPFEFLEDPGVVRMDPSWYQASFRFVSLGFFHILDGLDHLLFLLCLVIPFRRVRPLLLVVTAFTVGHSITLIGSALNLSPNGLWFPPLVETLIAMSIVYMALENIVGTRPDRRWMITLGFGLVHGFGFSFALGEIMQFAGAHLLTSLVAFNIGVELGQLLVLAVLLPVLSLTFRYVVAERIGVIVLSVIVAHTAWHWMVDRFEILRQYSFPSLSSTSLSSLLQWLTAIVFAGGVIWLISALQKKRARATASGATGSDLPD
jgi:hypothetical protein